MTPSNLPTDSGLAESDELQGELLEHDLNLPPSPVLAASVSEPHGARVLSWHRRPLELLARDLDSRLSEGDRAPARSHR